VSRRGWP